VPRRTNTRERLIETAAGLFWRQGYAQTGVNEIMQQAQTTSGSFYHFFPAKEDLLLAVVDHVGELLETEVFAAAAASSDDPVEQVFAVLDASRRHLESNDFNLGSPLGALAAELSASHPQVRERIAGLFDRWTERVSALLELAGDRLPTGLDRRALARFILAVAEGAILEARVSRNLAPFDAAVAELRRHLALLGPGAQPAVARPAQPRPTPRPQPRAADWRAW
jgi:AcrR family transcriptional regulator